MALVRICDACGGRIEEGDKSYRLAIELDARPGSVVIIPKQERDLCETDTGKLCDLLNLPSIVKSSDMPKKL